MGCVTSLPEEDRELRQKSAAIDRQLDEDYKKTRKECKILLLGSGESGKRYVKTWAAGI